MAPVVTPVQEQEIIALVETLIKEAPGSYWTLQLKKIRIGQRILKLTGDEHRFLVFHLG